MQILLLTHDPRLRQHRNRHLVRHLQDLDVHPVVLAPRQATVTVRGGDIALLDPKGLPVLPALVVNALYLASQRDLDLVRVLEAAGHRVVNRSESWYAAKVKPITAARLAAAGVPQPATAFSRGVPDSLWSQASALPGWAVVKPWDGAGGRGVHRCHDLRELRAWFRRQRRRGGPALAQEFVPNPGRDIRVMVAGDRPLGATYRIAPPGGWRTNVALGGRPAKCELTRELGDLAVRATRALDLDIAGVDIIEGPQGLQVLELNAWPDYELFDAALAVNTADRLARYVIARAREGRAQPETWPPGRGGA